MSRICAARPRMESPVDVDARCTTVVAMLCILALGACAEPEAAESPTHARYELDYDALSVLAMEHASSKGSGLPDDSVGLNDAQLARATRQLSFRLRESRVYFDLRGDGSWTWSRVGGRAPVQVVGTWAVEGRGRLRLVPMGDLAKPLTAEYAGDEIRFPKHTIPGGTPVQSVYRVVDEQSDAGRSGGDSADGSTDKQMFYLVDIGLEVVVTLTAPSTFELRATFDPYTTPRTLDIEGTYRELEGVNSVAIKRFLDSTKSTIAEDHSLRFTQDAGKILALMWPNLVPNPLVLRRFH